MRAEELSVRNGRGRPPSLTVKESRCNIKEKREEG